MFSHCSNSVWGRSRACVSSSNTKMRAGGAPFLARRAATYRFASTSGTLAIASRPLGLATRDLTHKKKGVAQHVNCGRETEDTKH